MYQLKLNEKEARLIIEVALSGIKRKEPVDAYVARTTVDKILDLASEIIHRDSK